MIGHGSYGDFDVSATLLPWPDMCLWVWHPPSLAKHVSMSLSSLFPDQTCVYESVMLFPWPDMCLWSVILLPWPDMCIWVCHPLSLARHVSMSLSSSFPGQKCVYESVILVPWPDMCLMSLSPSFPGQTCMCLWVCHHPSLPRHICLWVCHPLWACHPPSLAKHVSMSLSSSFPDQTCVYESDTLLPWPDVCIWVCHPPSLHLSVSHIHVCPFPINHNETVN